MHPPCNYSVSKKTRVYAIRISVERINEKKEINPSLKCKVYMQSLGFSIDRSNIGVVL